jgi:hypothetical protein
MTKKLTYQEWQASIEKGCPDAVAAGQGGSFCKLSDGTRGYCMYAYCQRRTDLK